MRYILASKSPRRREILSNIGIDFEVITADTDESSDLSDPIELAEELALRKGQAVFKKLNEKGEVSPEDIIISADTVVAYGQDILGKPKDRADARRMLNLLSGNTHRVISGVALIKDGKSFVSHSETLVSFDTIRDEDIERYISTKDPFDKAGAYGIQGLASLWVNRIDGCYFGVVGLPVNILDRLHRDCTGHSMI